MFQRDDAALRVFELMELQRQFELLQTGILIFLGLVLMLVLRMVAHWRGGQGNRRTWADDAAAKARFAAVALSAPTQIAAGAVRIAAAAPVAAPAAADLDGPKPAIRSIRQIIAGNLDAFVPRQPWPVLRRKGRLLLLLDVLLWMLAGGTAALLIASTHAIVTDIAYFALMIAGMALVPLEVALVRYARRFYAGAEAVRMLETDAPAAVYLRAFDQDRDAPVAAFHLGPAHRISVEDAIGSAVRRFMPLFGIGKPSEELSAGAAVGRLYVKDAHWQSIVDQMIAQAPVIFVRLATSPGLTWELGRIAAPETLRKVIFVPVATNGMPFSRAEYEQVRADIKTTVGFELPAGLWHCWLFRIDESGAVASRPAAKGTNNPTALRRATDAAIRDLLQDQPVKAPLRRHSPLLEYTMLRWAGPILVFAAIAGSAVAFAL